MQPSSILASFARSPASVVLLAGVLSGCVGPLDDSESAAVTRTEAPAASAGGARAPLCPAGDRARVHEGGSLRRGAVNEALYLADEDHDVVRVVPLPLGSGPARAVAVPGGPAQVLPLSGCVLVTVRDPGWLLVLAPDAEAGLREVGRVKVAADAWGIAVTPDERTALVTSAWTHTVTGVDLGTGEVRFAVDVAREPRGVVVRPDGQSAYVTHLMGADVTRIDGLAGAGKDTPSASSVRLAAAPLSAPRKDYPITFDLDASLGYSAVLSPAGDRLFVPRHALGGYGAGVWYGRPVVDVLDTADDSTAAPARVGRGIVKETGFSYGEDSAYSGDGAVPVVTRYPFAQPRDAVYREATRTLLVASEGHDTVVELDADSLDPALVPLRRYELGGRQWWRGDERRMSDCGAPTGIALSEDEDVAFVHCRSTGDLAVFHLDMLDATDDPMDAPLAVRTIHLADDPLPDEAARGRQLFYAAWDGEMSQGLGCAGCHPDGRDDGHVWHEQPAEVGGMTGTRTHEILNLRVGLGDPNGGRKLSAQMGYPRQTPMLAGRVSAKGPYAWHGDARTLDERIRHGFGVHRWHGDPNFAWGSDLASTVAKSRALAAFLRQGLVPPPVERRALTEQEARGKEVFESQDTGCATCHFPATGYTDRGLANVGPRPSPAGFLADPRRPRFKTPSLLFVGGTAPYYHDGSAATLRELIDDNHDRMGRTEALSEEDRAALVAYLATIGTVADEWTEPGDRRPEPVTDAVEVPEIVLASRAPALFVDGSTFAEDPPGEEPTAMPKPREWRDAPKVRLSRDEARCEARRLREWIQVRCPFASLAKLVAGPKEGVSIRGEGEDAVLVFAVRRGEQRLFVVEQIERLGRWWLTNDTTWVVSQDWPAGARAPEVRLLQETVRRATP